MARVRIVVPCYNEAELLDVEAFKGFAASCCDISFLFVDDGSTDTTGKMLDKLSAEHPERFAAHHLQQNSGKAEAVRQGILKALASEHDYVGFWDADLATPLELLPQLCAVLDERPHIEIVLTWRVQRQYEKKALRYLARHLLGKVFGRTAAAILGLSIHDTQCGAKLFRATDALPRLFAAPFLSRWIFDVEILARLAAERTNAAAAIHEFPFDSWRDVSGSKRSLSDYLTVARDLVRIYWKYRKAAPPG